MSSLNRYIQNNIDEFYSFVDDKLESIYNEKFSLFHYLFGELKTIKEINHEFPLKFKLNYFNDLSHNKIMTLRKEGIKYLEDNKNSPLIQKYTEVLKKYEDGGNVEDLWLSYNVNPISYCDDDPNGDEFNYFINNILNKILISITRPLQNDFRVSKGLPKIGEGWISETELFYLLKDNLQKEEIIHHGKPKWLGRQHVDIWFPKRKIGIEYQGIQHDKPIEYFGGEEGFVKGKERDKRKKKLFEENKSVLIEVREGYKIESIINEIKSHF